MRPTRLTSQPNLAFIACCNDNMHTHSAISPRLAIKTEVNEARGGSTALVVEYGLGSALCLDACKKLETWRGCFKTGRTDIEKYIPLARQKPTSSQSRPRDISFILYHDRHEAHRLRPSTSATLGRQDPLSCAQHRPRSKLPCEHVIRGSTLSCLTP